jgi:hypothetical protein
VRRCFEIARAQGCFCLHDQGRALESIDLPINGRALARSIVAKRARLSEHGHDAIEHLELVG